MIVLFEAGTYERVRDGINYRITNKAGEYTVDENDALDTLLDEAQGFFGGAPRKGEFVRVVRIERPFPDSSYVERATLIKSLGGERSRGLF